MVIVSLSDPMPNIILKSKSKNNLKLLLDVAKTIGIDVRLLTKKETLDTGLINAIKKARTHKKVNTKKYLQKLRDE
jgi:hypothetical protein